MAAPTTVLEIDNMALNRVGAKVITAAQLLANTEPRAIYCNLHYDQTRLSLLRSHWWRFAKARAELVAADAVDFEWSNAFTLPDDFLREKSVYEDNATIHKNTMFSYELEGNLLLTNESECNLRYIKNEETIANFDALFVEVFVLLLGLKIVVPIAGTGSAGRAIAVDIKEELYGSRGRPGLMARVRALDRQEGERIGRAERVLWNNSRSANRGRIDSQLGSA